MGQNFNTWLTEIKFKIWKVTFFKKHLLQRNYGMDFLFPGNNGNIKCRCIWVSVTVCSWWNLSLNCSVIAMFFSLSRVTCYTCQVLLAGGPVVLLRDHLFLSHQIVFLVQLAWFSLFCLCWGFTAQSTTRSCRAGQLIVVLFFGRLRPSKRLTSTKRGRPRQ